MQIEIDKAMELIYNIMHEQSENFTTDQLEALNLGLSALKTVADFKLNNVSRETILGRKLIKLAGYNCAGKSCTDCIYFDKSIQTCLPVCAGYIIHSAEKDMTFKYADTDSTHQNEKETKA